jgi:hypothetical protein
MMTQEFIISNIITVSIAFIGWFFAFLLIRGQYFTSLKLEKEKYAYEVRQKVAFDIIDAIMKTSNTSVDYIALIPVIKDIDSQRAVDGETFKRFNDLWNSFFLENRKLYDLLIGRKLLLSEFHDLCSEIIAINSEQIKAAHQVLDYLNEPILIDAFKNGFEQACKNLQDINTNYMQKLSILNEKLQEKFIVSIFK